MIEIIEALTKKQRKLFATFPVELYKDCPYYVPSLVEDEMALDNPKKNLSKRDSEVRCFLAYKDHQLVGRIAGIINHESNKKHHEKCIRFSRIDFIDDKEVSKALIETVACVVAYIISSKVRKEATRGLLIASIIVGPFSVSAMIVGGILGLIALKKEQPSE